MAAVGISMAAKAKKLSPGSKLTPVGGFAFLSLTDTPDAELEGSTEATFISLLVLSLPLSLSLSLPEEAVEGRVRLRGYFEVNMG